MTLGSGKTSIRMVPGARGVVGWRVGGGGIASGTGQPLETYQKREGGKAKLSHEREKIRLEPESIYGNHLMLQGGLLP